jgi:hypothetical protein
LASINPLNSAEANMRKLANLAKYSNSAAASMNALSGSMATAHSSTEERPRRRSLSKYRDEYKHGWAENTKSQYGNKGEEMSEGLKRYYQDPRPFWAEKSRRQSTGSMAGEWQGRQ